MHDSAHLNSNGRVELHQLRQVWGCQAAAEDQLGMGLQLTQHLLLLSWQQGGLQRLLQQPLEYAGLVSFPAAAEAVIPQQVKGQSWVQPLYLPCRVQEECVLLLAAGSVERCSLYNRWQGWVRRTW